MIYNELNSDEFGETLRNSINKTRKLCLEAYIGALELNFTKKIINPEWGITL